MSDMKKKELNALLRQGNKQIDEVKEQQLILIANYIYDVYGLQKRDIILVNGIRGVIVGFDFEGNAFSIRIRYKKIKANGNLDNVSYKTHAQYKIEKVGQYSGKID